MSTPIADTLNSRPNKPPATTIGRNAFYLNSGGEALFAWLHQPENACSSRHGVLICPPIGYEQVHSHRSLRHLADAVARAGLCVLRFDFHGTGDSAGTDENSDRVATWLANIHDAISWMENELGCEQITLFGLRLGATLAVQVAADHAVENLLLWAPVTKGRLFVSEMKMLGRMVVNKPPSLPEAPDSIEAAGFVLTQQTVDDLSKLDLLAMQPKCRRALIVAREDLAPDTRVVDRWLARGIQAEQIVQPGYAGMMAIEQFNQVPRQAISNSVAWLKLLFPPLCEANTCETNPGTSVPQQNSGAQHLIGGEANMPGQALMSHQQFTMEPVDAQHRIREQVWQISVEPNLFGILTEPEEGASAHLPVIVLTNCGTAYRVGPSRLYVGLSRHLAAHGFRTLRLDLCGLGDSVVDDAEKENDAFAATAFRDIDLTLKALQAGQTPLPPLDKGVKVVLMGLCSGAYVAFQSAAQMSSPLLVESVLINPLAFFWKEGMTIETAAALQSLRLNSNWRGALQPGRWWRLLSGKGHIGIAGYCKLFVEDLWRPSRQARDPVPTAKSAAELGHPLVEDVPADLDRVASAGRRLAFFFSTPDSGYSLLMFYAKRKVEQMRQAGILSVSFIQDADHTFSARVRRRTVVQAIAEHLLRRYQQSTQKVS